MSGGKTDMQRDAIDYGTMIKRASTRAAKLRLLDEFIQKHGSLPERLLHVFGHSEFVRGFDAGVRDATGGDQ